MQQIHRNQLDKYLNELLSPQLFSDYCPNGLQVEGSEIITHVITGVTASQALIDAAIDLQAQAVIVHHGYFWRNEAAPILGMKKRRIHALLAHNINLWAFHLPLDCHPILGNNTQLGNLLGLKGEGFLQGEGNTGLGLWDSLDSPHTGTDIKLLLEQKLCRPVLHIAPDETTPKLINTLGWCTGGAQNYIDKAIDLGLDGYISGEISEATVHSARENNIHYFAAGHHATERGGVMALQQNLHDTLGLHCRFVDIDNPA